jgi:hypothetical protein
MTPAFDEITPHPDGVGTDDLLPIHERAYIVRAYRRGLDTMILRGAVRDQKPPGLYIPEDPEPLTMHHMIVDLHIAVPSLVIEKVDVALEVHPHTACPRIEENYQGLLGLSIARGFINTVRQMFGGPRGCTHTTALLQAMAPVAIQSMWSFRMAQAAADGVEGNAFSTPEGREQGITMNLNTCHVWAEDGEQVTSIRAGEPHEVPVWMTKRLEQLGIDPTRPF